MGIMKMAKIKDKLTCPNLKCGGEDFSFMTETICQIDKWDVNRRCIFHVNELAEVVVCQNPECSRMFSIAQGIFVLLNDPHADKN